MSGILSDPKKIPPTEEEVRAYFGSLGSSVDPEKFYLYYQMRGWKAGRVPMRDWHAAAKLWHRNETTNSRSGSMSHGMSEWERKQKLERLRDLRERLRDITHPGGAAYPAQLDERRQTLASHLQVQITDLKRELEP